MGMLYLLHIHDYIYWWRHLYVITLVAVHASTASWYQSEVYTPLLGNHRLSPRSNNAVLYCFAVTLYYQSYSYPYYILFLLKDLQVFSDFLLYNYLHFYYGMDFPFSIPYPVNWSGSLFTCYNCPWMNFNHLLIPRRAFWRSTLYRWSSQRPSSTTPSSSST